MKNKSDGVLYSVQDQWNQTKMHRNRSLYRLVNARKEKESTQTKRNVIRHGAQGEVTLA